MTDAGAEFKDTNKKLWKLKEKVVGPKVGPAEPSCINDPNTGELTKNPIRDCDREELKRKKANQEKIMNRKDNREYVLDRKLYKAVMKDIKKKNKGMFNLLNKAGDRYKRPFTTT